MEPITFVVTALTLGIATGLKPVAEQAVKDAYIGLKTLIEQRYKVSLSGLENKPDSETQVAAVKENLTATGADRDEELLDKAKELLDLAKQYAPETPKAKGFNLRIVEAEYIKAKKILAEGADAVNLENVKTKGGIEIEDVTAVSDPKAKRQ